MVLTKKILGKLVVAKTTEEMLSIAANHRFLVDEKIDLRSVKIRFDHEGLDLSKFHFCAADLSGSKLKNCNALRGSFVDCRLNRVRITAEGGVRCSFSGCAFDGATIAQSYLGPRTLDLSGSTFRAANIIGTTFMLASLGGADFSDACLSDVMLRGADLSGVSFRGAKLEKVCLEKADLKGADFTGATFVEMEQWGEPDFTEATISDDLKYQYGIVADPVQKLDHIINSNQFSEAELEEVRRFQDSIFDFASSSQEVMLIGAEYQGVISMPLFIRLMKLMKVYCPNGNCGPLSETRSPSS